MPLKTNDFTQSKLETEAKAPEFGNHYDLIIIGGGPAGMAAALYGHWVGLKVLLLEQAILGGAVNATFQIENYPGFPQPVKGAELINLMAEQIKRLGVEILFASVSRAVLTGPKKVFFTQDGRMLTASTLIIASGATNKKLKVPGEEEFLGRGISYCAICDAPFYKGKKVAVIGGGDSAVEEALYLSDFAATVTVIHRRDQLRSAKILEKRAFEKANIHFLWDSEVKEFKGDKRLTDLVVFNHKENQTREVAFDGVFIYVGVAPVLNFVAEEINRSEDGFIVTDEEMKTSLEGIFAAGDVRKKSLRQIVTSVSDGAVAAVSAFNYLRSH